MGLNSGFKGLTCSLISAGPITAAAETRRYSAITGQPITGETAAAATLFSDVMPHSATDMYQCCDVVFCLCCQGSLPFTWSQQVAPKYCDVLPDYTASHPRTPVVLTTLAIFSVCSS